MNLIFKRIAIVAVSTAAILLAACSPGSVMGGAGDAKALAQAKGKPVTTATSTSLGTAANYVILGGGPTVPSVTITSSAVTGNVGSGIVAPAPADGKVTLTSSAVTGNVNADVIVNTSSTVTGTGPSDPAAYASFLAAYAAVGATPLSTATLLSGTLAGVVLTPGVYYFSAAAALTGVLTLNTLGDPNATWTFLIGTSGTGALTGTNFTVQMTPGGNPGNVTWWVHDAATMTTSNFIGTILAGSAVAGLGEITFTGGTFTGHAFAKDAVTLTGMTSFVASAGTTVGGGGTTTPPACRDFVTGGGWIGVGKDNGHKGWFNDNGRNGGWFNRGGATFAVSGGFKNGDFWGHLEFNDHNGEKVHSTGVTNYVVVDDMTRWIYGTCTVNGAGSYTYKVVVVDNDTSKGHPGKSAWHAKDSFGLDVFNGSTDTYSVPTTVLSGGSINIHDSCAAIGNDGKGNDRDKENYNDQDERDGDNNCDRR